MVLHLFAFLVALMVVVAVVSEDVLATVFFKVGSIFVFIGFVIIFVPSPCPRCGKPFMLWNFKNVGNLIEVAFKSVFKPLLLLEAFFSPSCPHCQLTFGEDWKVES